MSSVDAYLYNAIKTIEVRVKVMMFIATLNNISAISYDLE